MKKTTVVKIKVDGKAEGEGSPIRRVDLDKELETRGPSWTSADRNQDVVLHMRIQSSLRARGTGYCCKDCFSGI